jgi:hypothetical protein
VDDLTFRGIGAEMMSLYWPVFAAGAALEVWLVRRIRRVGRFPAYWIVSTLLATAGLSAALWAQGFIAVQLAYQTVGEGARVNVLQELGWHFARTRPLLAPLGVVLLVLVMRPRSDRVVTGLVVAAGVIVSWIVAMWLFTGTHQPLVLGLLVLPGALGVVASLIGFSAATALWMAIGRWIWKQGRRRRGITAHADGNLPESRR